MPEWFDIPCIDCDLPLVHPIHDVDDTNNPHPYNPGTLDILPSLDFRVEIEDYRWDG